MSKTKESLLRELIKQKLKLLISKRSNGSEASNQAILSEILDELKKEKSSFDESSLRTVLLESRNDNGVFDKFLEDFKITLGRIPWVTAGGRGHKEVNLENSDGTVINPSTEEKQDDTITAITDKTEFFFRVITGYTGTMASLDSLAFGGNNPNVTAGAVETIWTQSGKIKNLTANTQLYVSSTNAGDSQLVVVLGEKIDGTDIATIAVLDGQNQVALSGTQATAANLTIISGTDFLGDIYVAEQATGGDLVGGVPQTASKIQNKTIAADNFGVTGVAIVPPDKSLYVYDPSGTVSRGKDANIIFRFKFAGSSVFIQTPPFNIYEMIYHFNTIGGFVIPAGTYIELACSTADSGAGVSFGLQGILF